MRLSRSSSSFINGITSLKMLFQRAVYITNYFVRAMNEIIESLQKLIKVNLIYSYSFPSGFFVLNNQSGALSLSRPLDYETAVQYVLNISASDLGEPRLQNFTDVTVNVIDVNDNSPVLQPRTVRVSLIEVRKRKMFTWTHMATTQINCFTFRLILVVCHDRHLKMQFLGVLLPTLFILLNTKTSSPINCSNALIGSDGVNIQM